MKQAMICRPLDTSQRYKVRMSIGSAMLGVTADLYEVIPDTLENKKVAITSRMNSKDVREENAVLFEDTFCLRTVFSYITFSNMSFSYRNISIVSGM